MTKTILLALIYLVFCLQLSAQKPVLIIPTGHSSSIHAVSCSSDGKYFLTAGDDNLVKIWNAEGQEIRTFKPVNAEYRQTQLAPDGKRFLAAYCQESAEAWILDVLTGEKVYTLEGTESPLTVAKYAPDGQIVITADERGMLSLWNAGNGELLRRWEGYDTAVTSLCFSLDGKYLAGNAANGVVKIWDPQTGVENQALSAALMKDSLKVTGFSPDGKMICAISLTDRFEVVLWSMETRQKIATTHGYNCFFSPDGANICVFQFSGAAIVPANNLNAAPLHQLVAPMRPSDVAIPFYNQDGMFLPDGKSLLLYADAYPVVFDVLTSKALWAMKGYAEPVQSVAFSPDGTNCLVGSRHGIIDWDLKDGQVARKLTGHAGDVRQARFTPDGQKIVSVGNDYVGLVWEEGSGDTLFSATGLAVLPLQSYAGIMAISPDGQYFAKGHSPGWEKDFPEISLWNLKDGSLHKMIGENKDGVFANNCDLAFSPDGHWLAVLESTGVKLWDLSSGNWAWQHVKPNQSFSSIAFSRDGSRLIVGDALGVLEVLNTQTGARIFTNAADVPIPVNDYSDAFWLSVQNRSGAGINDLVVSPDGKWIAAPGPNKTIQVLDAASLKLVQTFSGHDNLVYCLDISPDNRWLISGSADNTVRIWDMQNGGEVARIIHLTGHNWVVTTPSGLFDASQGAMNMMYFLSGNEVIELEQLKERYYEPGLLSKVLGLASGEMRKVDQLKDLELFPEVEAAIVQNELKITLTPRNGGIGKVSLFINGAERGPEDINPERKERLSIDLKTFDAFFLRDTVNVIALRVYNAKGWLKSQAYKVNYAYSGRKGGGHVGDTHVLGNTKPRLFAIVVGTADYSGEKLDLKYADQDALAIAQAMTAAGKELFNEEVYLQSFHTGVLAENTLHATAQVSTKANIRKAFEALSEPGKVLETDVLLLYFSGHGITYGEAEKAQFYYLTKDIASEDLSDPEVRNNFTISSEDLTAWIKKIPALKLVLILDACNSGKIVENLASIGQKEINPSQVRAIDKMKDRTGMFILTGSAADKVSFEASQYGQGLLTYSILEGMNISKAKGEVDVMELFQHSRNRVPELAKSINGVQTPVLAFPTDGSSFPIGIVNDRVKIPLAQLKPIFIRNNFQDEDAFEDVLGLTDALEQYFLTQTIKGAQSRIVYWDVKEYENAYAMKGRYSIKDSEVEVRFKLFKGKTVVGEEIKLTGKKEDVPGLVKEILKVVMPMAK